MYHQGFSQPYGSYSDPYAAPPSTQAPPESVNVILDDYNSDLNFVIQPDGVTGASLHQNGFEYIWGGARGTHGVRSGKVMAQVCTVLRKAGFPKDSAKAFRNLAFAFALQYNTFIN